MTHTAHRHGIFVRHADGERTALFLVREELEAMVSSVVVLT